MDRKRVDQYRFALFGRMVMGVAHEVDNYLSVIMGFAELIQISGAGEKKSLDSVGKILHAGERINNIIKHFSYYVRPHAPLREPFSPADMVGECIVFSRFDLGRNNVTLVLPESYPAGFLNGDRRDIALTLLALLFNGAEAMAEQGGGVLKLEASRGDGFWEFAVTDEGAGIPPGITTRIFEEGFSTKNGPANNGMGLPVARCLAGEMGGTLYVENLPGGGCGAVLRIPG
ncbi:MAG: HAMP domain-containing sensor histidine kinase [Deltaproteobacteria bacterium]|nr:HAMP domain-containing sensor histidine kinase [Deltaproteobacteria bacterium]